MGYGLNMEYHNDVGAGEKTLIKYPFDLSGKQDIQWNYIHCTRSNKCITLKHGKIYTCPMAAHAGIIRFAKEFFGLEIELSENDSINIYKIETFEEITNFLIHPIPFCRYCNPDIKDYSLSWEPTTKKIDEWT